MNFLMYLVLEHEVSKIYIKSSVFLRILIDIEHARTALLQQCQPNLRSWLGS